MTGAPKPATLGAMKGSTLMILWMTAVASVLLAGCDRSERAEPRTAGSNQPTGRNASATPSSRGVFGGEDVVVTTFYPTAYFAERIAQGTIPVRCRLPAGEDPNTWQPRSEDVQEFQRAGLVVMNGARFERWAPTAALPESRVVDASRGFQDEFIVAEKTTHSHGAAGMHSHEGVDGHTWMDPLLAVRQARAIHKAMVQRWPQHQVALDSGLKGLEDDLNGLHTRFADIAPKLKAVRLLANHSAYAYLARRHGLRVHVIDLVPDEMPDDGAWEHIIEDMRAASSEPAGGNAGTVADRCIMLFEAEPLPQIQQKLGSLGVATVVFSPCESTPSAPASRTGTREDYLSLMQANIERLAAAAMPSTE